MDQPQERMSIFELRQLKINIFLIKIIVFMCLVVLEHSQGKILKMLGQFLKQ